MDKPLKVASRRHAARRRAPAIHYLGRHAKLTTLVALIGAMAALTPESASAENATDTDLADLSLEQLSNIEVTSVSKRAESLQDAPASIYVISAEDIRRSGVNTLPEALRLAPNLQVARVSASSYAISARGFNNAIGNKLLVLIDGRTVYTPLFSGVFWDAQDVMLEDIERIEVISGPGATLWGANAMNGVINIITRSAKSTQGTLVTAGGGNRETGAAVRTSGTFGDDGRYRVYAKGFSEFNTEQANGASLHDRFDRAQIGFRADRGDAASNFTLQGDAYDGQSDPDISGRPTLSGMNLLGRWTTELAGGSSFRVQTYYDHTQRDDPYTFADRVDLFDVEFQHAFNLTADQKFLWGGGARYARDSTFTHFGAPNPLPEAFLPARQSLEWGNLFAQDEIALGRKVELTLGFKVETNVYTHAEYLPDARLSWKPVDNAMLWAEASRSVRAPARLDRDFFLYLSLPNHPLIPVISGGPDFQSEVAHVYEIGYRAQPTPTLSYSITTFYSQYYKLRSGEPPPSAMVQNMIEGPTDGLEAWGTWRVANNWKVSAEWLEMRERLHLLPGSTDPTGPSALGNDPKHQVELRSSHELSDRLELDVLARHVGALPNPVVPAYTAVDMRLGWHLNRSVDLSLTVQNMFDPKHIEYGTPGTASEIDRSVYLKLLWRI
jgi:iron complex outermembrane receptor protein